MNIIVLGGGCAKCKTLEMLTRKVVADKGLEATVTKEEDITKIISYGISRTPGLVVDGKVVASGRIPSEDELAALLTS
jgi:small redox-active disulfide protein 2